jgi:hypothetical protein
MLNTRHRAACHHGQKVKKSLESRACDIIFTVDILMIILIVPPGFLDSSLEKQHD